MAALSEKSWEVTLVDAYLEGLSVPQTLARLDQNTAPCFVGITVLSPAALETARQIIAWLRQSWPDTAIVLGGYYATFCTQPVLESVPEGVIVVRGEGEATLAELSECLFAHQDWRSVAGTSHRQGPEIRHAPPRPLIANLDCLPFPSRPTLDQVFKRGGYPSICSSRGCFHRCSFCQVCQFYRQQAGPAFRARSPANVVAEILEVVTTSGQRNLGFVDDEFVGPGRLGVERTLEFCRQLEAANTRVVFGIQCRADSVERGLFERLRDVGLHHVFVGVESISARQLRLFDKHSAADRNRQALEILDELGIAYNIGIILFDPYSQLDEIAETADFLRSVRGFPIALNGLTILPGTTLEARVAADGLLENVAGDLGYRFVHPELELFRALLHSYADFSVPVVSRMRKLSGGLGARGNPTGALRNRIGACFRQVRELHIAFLDQAVGLLRRGKAAEGLLRDLGQEYSNLDAELDRIESESTAAQPGAAGRDPAKNLPVSSR